MVSLETSISKQRQYSQRRTRDAMNLSRIVILFMDLRYISSENMISFFLLTIHLGSINQVGLSELSLMFFFWCKNCAGYDNAVRQIFFPLHDDWPFPLVHYLGVRRKSIVDHQCSGPWPRSKCWNLSTACAPRTNGILPSFFVVHHWTDVPKVHHR